MLLVDLAGFSIDRAKRCMEKEDECGHEVKEFSLVTRLWLELKYVLSFVEG